MKSLIVYTSFHHQNTEKIAKEIGAVLNADLKKTNKVTTQDFSTYDLIGFGSGIYLGKHHKQLFSLIKKVKAVENKKAFIFSTRGMPWVGNWYHRELRKLLKEKGFRILGEFSCLGFDTNGILKKIGGIAKGHPDKNDCKQARTFAKQLLQD
jgi:flavodoxin